MAYIAVFLLFLTWAVPGFAEPAGPPRLLAGTSQAEITPPLGTPLLGALVGNTGVHDALFARTLVIGDGAQRAAIVCLDLVGMDFATADEIRARVRERCGIATTLLCSTHTHSAPFTVPWSVEGGRWLQGEGQAWRKQMMERVTETVAQAAANLTEATLRVGRAPAHAGLNRRQQTPKGVVMKPNAQGPIVPWVDVLRVDGPDGRARAILFSHAAHPVIVHGASTLVSADYPASAVDTVRRQFGSSTAVMFAQACGANINGEPLRGGFEAAQRAGEALGRAAAKAAAESRPLAPARLDIRSVRFDLPLQDWPPVDVCRQALEKGEATLAQAKARSNDERTWWYAQDNVGCLRDLLAKATRGEPGTLRFDINLLALGDQFCLLTLTHEVFAEYQLWADRHAPFRHTMVLGYTNGCESYVPTDADFALGGYEATASPEWCAALRYCHRQALKPGAERQIREQMQSLWSARGQVQPAR